MPEDKKGNSAKQSIYLPEDMRVEIVNESIRQDRSISWMIQKAWKLSRGTIMKFPSEDK